MLVLSETFGAYIEQGERDYSPYFETHPDVKVTDGSIRLFRRTGNPHDPQLASGFRGGIGTVRDINLSATHTIEVPSWFSHDPYTEYRDTIMTLEEATPELTGCRVPPIDRLQALYLQKAYGTPVAWLSATHDEKLAREKIWPHLPLLILNVPLEYVMPAGEILNDTFRQLGSKEKSAEPTEVGIFGGIEVEWVVAIEQAAK